MPEDVASESPAAAADPARVEPAAGASDADWEATFRLARALEENANRVLVGKPDAVRLALTALLADGHLLIEDVPGVGKTLLARALAKSLSVTFRRIQFTPDLLPADVTGCNVFDPRAVTFEFRPGPVLTNILLADEINRATPRTQSALLECMEERQVTVDGTTHRIEAPFFVVGTENSIEQQGTFPLPEAQLDRFALCIEIGYPASDDAIRILAEQQHRQAIDEVEPVASGADLVAAQASVRSVHVDDDLRRYVIALIEATREHGDVLLGASPRASLVLLRTAQAAAVLAGERFCTPQHVQTVAHAALEHRIIIRPKSRLTGVTAARVVDQIVAQIPVPVGRDS